MGSRGGCFVQGVPWTESIIVGALEGIPAGGLMEGSPGRGDLDWSPWWGSSVWSLLVVFLRWSLGGPTEVDP
jgi:hypothetical protein